MKHEQIFDMLLSLDNSVDGLHRLLRKMRDGENEKASDSVAPVKWERMTFNTFMSGGAKDILDVITNNVNDARDNLRDMVGSDEKVACNTGN